MTSGPLDSSLPAAGPGAWTLWTVLGRPGAATPSADSAVPPLGAGPTLTEAADDAPDDVTLRGVYDVSGMRAGADLMVWLHGDRPEALQAELRRLRRTTELGPLAVQWSAMGVHRPAEFSADHAPAYLRGTAPAQWLTVYPFVRSYEWYLLPSDERRALLGEHGRKGRAFTSVLANTVSAFALGDYEWLLAFEADDPTDLVDLMRALRETEARRHVRDELPFYTGRRVELDEVAGVVL